MSGVLGELMARECGLLNGKGGSMHLTSVEHGAMGSYAIIGAHLPIAMGAAWSGAQYRGTKQVSVCFFGRRDHQYRRLPRGPQHGADLEAAGDLRVLRTTSTWNIRRSAT